MKPDRVNTDVPHQSSMIARLAQTPRIFVLAGVMTLSGTTFGTREVTRLALINSLVGAEWGVSVLAVVVAVFSAVAAVLTGRLVDRWDPRLFVFTGLGLAAGVSVVTAALVTTERLTVSGLIIVTALDAMSIGLGLPSMLKVQAAIVRPNAVGGAEMLNVLRIGVGSVVGALVAGALNNVQATLWFSAVALTITTALVWLVLRPVVPRAKPMVGIPTGPSVWRYLKGSEGMRRLIIVDLALTFVIPTQFVNLVLVGGNYAELFGLCVAAGMVGVLVGRLALLVIGFRGNPSYVVLGATLGLLAMQLVTVYLLANSWLMGVPWLLVVDIAVGTVMLTYAQGLLAALVQQNVAEEVRGSLSGGLIAGRAILISIAALIAAVIGATYGAQVLLGTLAISLLIVVVATKGFRGLSVTNG